MRGMMRSTRSRIRMQINLGQARVPAIDQIHPEIRLIHDQQPQVGARRRQREQLRPLGDPDHIELPDGGPAHLRRERGEKRHVPQRELAERAAARGGHLQGHGDERGAVPEVDGHALQLLREAPQQLAEACRRQRAVHAAQLQAAQLGQAVPALGERGAEGGSGVGAPGEVQEAQARDEGEEGDEVVEGELERVAVVEDEGFEGEERGGVEEEREEESVEGAEAPAEGEECEGERRDWVEQRNGIR